VTAKRRAEAALVVLSAIVLVVIALFPIAWMFATSLKTDNQIFSVPPVWIFHPTFEHYRHVLADLGMASALENSLIVGVSTTVLAIVLGAPAGYAIARFRFRFRRDVWFWFISNDMMIPIILVIPYFLIARTLHLINSPLMLVLAYRRSRSRSSSGSRPISSPRSRASSTRPRSSMAPAASRSLCASRSRSRFPASRSRQFCR